MKNKSESRSKRLVKRLFNVRGWVDFDRVRTGGQWIISAASTYFIPQQARVTESFDEAKRRLNLTDKDLHQRQVGLLRLSLIMLGAGLLVFCYAIYNLFYAHYTSVLLSLVVTGLALVLAFRYHFWYFQIKQHKLGCTLPEWFHSWFKQGVTGANDE